MAPAANETTEKDELFATRNASDSPVSPKTLLPKTASPAPPNTDGLDYSDSEEGKEDTEERDRRSLADELPYPRGCEEGDTEASVGEVPQQRDSLKHATVLTQEFDLLRRKSSVLEKIEKFEKFEDTLRNAKIPRPLKVSRKDNAPERGITLKQGVSEPGLLPPPRPEDHAPEKAVGKNTSHPSNSAQHPDKWSTWLRSTCSKCFEGIATFLSIFILTTATLAVYTYHLRSKLGARSI